ncbi:MULTISPECIES: TetR/AcrR family transcriptional regulator [unclassified Mycolicibacterium]|uniref:TetR/AcrR family transcriptional regulator n=1 Tax=unclassified Mycolicibacterium TaxID=2636767 RepID=UPI002EDA8D89
MPSPPEPAARVAAPTPPSRQQRRKQQTRSRLVGAARALIAERGVEGVGMSDIAQAADLGAGTIYNYFQTRDQIVEAVAEESVESMGEALDRLTHDLTDAAEVFAFSLRHLVRRAATDPIWGWFVVRLGVAHPVLISILGPRAGRDLRKGVDSGRFSIPDVEIATSCVFGALLSTLHQILSAPAQPGIDEVFARTMLCMVGVPFDAAADIAARPLPDLPETTP